MKNLFLMILMIFFIFSSCSSTSDDAPLPQQQTEPPAAVVIPESVTEISLRGSTGLLGSAFTIVLRRDGSARCECTFYNLDEAGKPGFKYPESVCGRLYDRDPSVFVKVDSVIDNGRLEGVFAGTVAAERFEELANLFVKNDFISMPDKNTEIRMDDPPDITRIVYAGKIKEVADRNDEGDKKLSEIKQMIYELSYQTKWESEKN